MNRGARQATGDLPRFLHADTLTPDDLVSVAERTFAESSIAAVAISGCAEDSTRACRSWKPATSVCAWGAWGASC